MGTRYFAGKRITVHGKTRNVGDEVPEAAGFANLRAYLSTGQIITVEDAAPAEPEATLEGEFVSPSLDALRAVFESAKADALKTLAAELGVDTSGNKAVIAARLVDTMTFYAPAPADDEASDEEDD